MRGAKEMYSFHHWTFSLKSSFQYVVHVKRGQAGFDAGMRVGDRLLMVNKTNVEWTRIKSDFDFFEKNVKLIRLKAMTHKQVVDVIKREKLASNTDWINFIVVSAEADPVNNKPGDCDAVVMPSAPTEEELSGSTESDLIVLLDGQLRSFNEQITNTFLQPELEHYNNKT